MRANHPFEESPVTVFSTPTPVEHWTTERAARSIARTGFRTGEELGVHERRRAVYFAGPGVNAGLYARNEPGDTNEGQPAAVVGIDVMGLRLLNLTWRVDGRFPYHDRFKDDVTRGDLENLPPDVDGAVAFLPDGRIFEVALPAALAEERRQGVVAGAMGSDPLA